MPPRQEVLAAEASLKKTEARRDTLEREHGRSERLIGVIAPLEFERTRGALEESRHAAEQARQALEQLRGGPRAEVLAQAQAEVSRAEAAVQESQLLLENTRIRSPMDGFVVALSAQVGARVVPGPEMPDGAPFCDVADLSEMRVVIDIPEGRAEQIKLDMPCIVTTEAHPSRPLRGSVEWLAKTYNRQRGVRRAHVLVPEPGDDLLPEMTCRVRVVADELGEDLTPRRLVPERFVAGSGVERAVFVERDGVATRRPVVTARPEGIPAGMIELADGVSDGEVLLDPASVAAAPRGSKIVAAVEAAGAGPES